MDILTTLNRVQESLNKYKIFDNVQWLQHQIKRGRLYEVWLTIIPMMTEVMELVHPGNWDLQVNMVVDNYKIHINFLPIIRFPKLTVSNSNRESLAIKDLFIMITTTVDGRLLRFLGTRTTVSQKEVLSKYVHSHLPRSDYNDIQMNLNHNKYFCTGSGEINQIIVQYNNNLGDKTFFTILMMYLTNFASHESIEGGPYINISDIINYRNAIITSEHKISNMSSIKNTIFSKAEVLDRKLNFRKNGKIFEVIDDEKFENFCKLMAIDPEDSNSYINYRQSVCIKGSEGNYYLYYSGVNNRILVDVDNVKPILFRGKLIPLVVIKDNKAEDNSNTKLYVHPYIKKEIKKYVEDRIVRGFLRKGIMQGIQTQSGYRPENNQPDTLPF